MNILMHKLISARRILYFFLSVSLIIQLVQNDINNSIMAVISFASSWITIYFVLRQSVFSNYTLPSFVILSFMFSILSGPLIFQSFSFNMISYNLKEPIYIVVLSSFFLFSMIISLFLFIQLKFFRISNILRDKLNYKLGLFSIPSNMQLWIMGAIGLIALVIESTYKFSSGAESGDASQKFLEGFKFLTYAPFLIPLINIVYLKKILPKKTIYQLGTFTLFLFIISMAQNSRSVFIDGFFMLFVLSGIFILTGQIILSKKIKRLIIIIFLLIVTIIPQLSDFAISMVIAREQRSNLTPIELVDKTLEVFSNKEKINRFKEAYLKFTQGFKYNETYLNNPFLDRLIYIKFFDNMISLQGVMNGDYSKKIYDITIDQLIALLPTPIIQLIGYHLDKTKLKFSMGDYMYNLEKHYPVGGFKVGSTTAHGFSMFGYFVFIILIPLYMLLFTFIQSLFTSKDNQIFIAPVVMLLIMKLYFISMNDNFFGIIGFLFRNLPQAFFLYLIVYFITKIFIKGSNNV